MNEQEVIATQAIESSHQTDPSLAGKSANTQAMFNTVKDLTVSSDGLDEAKDQLNASIAKMMAEDDPFMQMMIAIYEVIPGTMLYKEEKLIYDTESFKFVTELNNHMTKMMDFYSKSSDYQIETNAGLANETGSSTGGTGDDVWGLAAGEAYIKEMEDLKALVMSSGLPDDIKAAMESAFAKIGVASSSSLWNGLAGSYRVTGDNPEFHSCDFTSCGSWVQYNKQHGAYDGHHDYYWACNKDPSPEDLCGFKRRECWAAFNKHVTWKDKSPSIDYMCKGHVIGGAPTPEGKYEMSVGDSDWSVIRDQHGNTIEGYSQSMRRTQNYQPAVESSTTGNLELQTVINSYSATVEAEYRYDMEQYNTYANTSAQSMRAHIDQVAAPVTRLTHISHA